MRQRQYQKLSFGKIQEIAEFQMTLTLFGNHLAAREKLAEPPVSFSVARIDQNIRRAVHEDDPRADQKLRLVLNVRIVELGMGAHDTGERVVIGNTDGVEAKLAGLVHIVLRMRSAAQEGKIGRDADLGISNLPLALRKISGIRGHANSPCTYQFAGAGLPSSSSSSLP